MAGIHKRLAKKLNFEYENNQIYGSFNDFFINIILNKAPKKSVYSNLIEKLFEPKYDSANIYVYTNRKNGIDIKQISNLFEENYWIYCASRFKEVNGGFFLFLQKNGSVNIKLSYIEAFLEFLTNWLKSESHYSSCNICRSDDNLSMINEQGHIKVVCENCRLKTKTL